MPVTARKLMLYNVTGAGKKAPSSSYSHASGRLQLRGCECVIPPPPPGPPGPFTVSYTEPGGHAYTLPSGYTWSITYNMVGGGGGGGPGGPGAIDELGNIISYGFPGLKGFDADPISGTFTTTETQLVLFVGIGGPGGDPGSNGTSGDPSILVVGNFVSQIQAEPGQGGPGGSSGADAPGVADPVSTNPGNGGRGGDSGQRGSDGIAGYVMITATAVV